MPKPIVLTQEVSDKLVAAYQGGASLAGAAKPFGLSHRATIQALFDTGLRQRTVSEAARRYFYNDHFFDVIDTEEKAYWLGFVLADGYIYRDEYQRLAGLSIRLAAVDTGHLEKFRQALDSNLPVSQYTAKIKGQDKVYPSCRLLISSPHIAEQLGEYGIIPNKSLTAVPYLDFPVELHRHYWRGVVDGDGSIFSAQGRRSWRIGLVGSYEVVEAFRNFLVCKGIIFNSKIQRHGRNAWQTTFTGSALPKKIGELLWADATIYLDRKYEKYCELRDLEVVRHDRSNLTKEYLLDLKTRYRTWGEVAKYLKTSPGRLSKRLRAFDIPCKRGKIPKDQNSTVSFIEV